MREEDVKVTADSGLRSRETERVHPSPPTPSIPHSGKPDSTRTSLLWLLRLIVPSDDTDTSPVLDHVPEDRPNESTEPNAVANEPKSNWKSTASASAKLLLRAVRDSADAFGPLKSVAGGLCFVLENYEVWPSSRIRHLGGLQVS